MSLLNEPTPILASPSVHTTTTEPVAPSEAIPTAVATAGPKAVYPFSSSESKTDYRLDSYS